MSEQCSSSHAGFTLIEVLVALAVASILCMTYLGVMRQTAQFAGDARAIVRNILLAQEYLLQHPATTRQQPSLDWIEWAGEPKGSWRLSASSTLELTMMRLETRVSGLTMRWEWVRP